MTDYKKQTSFLILVFCALAMSGAGCKKVSSGIECSNDEECGQDAVCRFGECLSTADTDEDGDDDSGADGDADGDCDSAVEGIGDWGYECEDNSDCTADGLVCLYLEFEGANPDKGYCTPICCNLFQYDEDYCTDVADGTEACLFFNGTAENPEKRWCGITCKNGNENDCPDGHECLVYPGLPEAGVCYPSNK